MGFDSPRGATNEDKTMPIKPENKGRYPKDWRTISLAIRDRAEWRCECEGECGRGKHYGRCPNKQNEPAFDSLKNVILTVSHLDHQPENCDPSNLKAMCQACHLAYDKEHHAKSRKETKAKALRETNHELF